MSQIDEPNPSDVVLGELTEKPVPAPVDCQKSYLLRNYFYNGQIAEEGIIINGVVDGVKKQWHSNGKLYIRQAFRCGIPNGSREVWGEHGKIIEESIHVNGRLHGVCRKFDHSGQILLETHYEYGLPHGKNRIWFPNGQVRHEEFFCKGFRNSTQKEWYSDGNIKCTAEYKMGVRDGLKQSWHRNGRLQSEEVFRSNALHGISRHWNLEGRIRRRFSHFGGRLHGEQLEWNDAGEQIQRQFYTYGVRIPQKYEILIRHDRLKAKHILRIRNAEVRRICLEALGYARFLAQIPHEIIHQDGEQDLVMIHWHKNEEPICLVKVRCPTTGAFYVLRVPPHMKTVKHAVAWTFGMNASLYKLEVET